MGERRIEAENPPSNLSIVSNPVKNFVPGHTKVNVESSNCNLENVWNVAFGSVSV